MKRYLPPTGYLVHWLLAVALLAGAAGCSTPPTPSVTPPAPSVAPSASPTVATATASPPPSTPTAVPSPSPVPTSPTVAITTAPAPVVTAAPSPTLPTPSPAPSPTPIITPGIANVTVSTNRATQDFPNKITFSLAGSSQAPVKNIVLSYGSSKRSLTSEVTRVQPQFSAGTEINTSDVWEMKKTGSIPPGVMIWWQWQITDSTGAGYTTPKQSVTWEDSRFSWQIWTSADLDMYYLNQPADMMKELNAGLQSGISRVNFQVDIPKERKPRVYVYNNSEQIRGAVLFAQDWTGALAYPSYNVILTAVSSSNLQWAKGALPHEVTHLRVGEALFGPFGRVPTWLNEGLAQYSEGAMTPYYRGIFDKAKNDGKLISVRSLSSTFPEDGAQASLAYAESQSLVTYLVETYGWTKMQELLAVFKDGSSYDNALKKVYGFDMDGLDRQWRGAPLSFFAPAIL